MERIMVGTDGSESAGAALRWAGALAGATGAQLLVAHSYLPPQAELDPGFDARCRADAEQALAGWISQAGVASAIPVLVEGDARETLGDLASEQRADLLVLGSRGGGGFSRLGLGSVAHHVAHHVGCSIAVVPVGSELVAGAPILVGVDGSPSSAVALRWAIGAAASTKSPVTAALAYDAMADSYPHPDLDNWKYRNQAESEALVEACRAPGVALELRVVPGNAVAALDDLATAHEAAAIVVGTRGRGSLHRTFLGRVPMQLLNHAVRPVVVTRA
ncbi:MAG: hypothetical protein GEV08_16510 [Acidimicrobiia bacterium]|nr:hypothetical protein [Acidimicrobiia bacterium]